MLVGIVVHSTAQVRAARELFGSETVLIRACGRFPTKFDRIIRLRRDDENARASEALTKAYYDWVTADLEQAIRPGGEVLNVSGDA